MRVVALASGVVALAAGVVLGPASAAAWNWGGGEEQADQWPAVRAAWAWMEPRGLLGPDREHSTMAWGLAHGLAMLFLLPTLWAAQRTLAPAGSVPRSGKVVSAAVAAGTVAMACAYLPRGFGFPFDLLAFLVACVASVVQGAGFLRAGRFRWAGWMLAVGLPAELAASFWWCMGYVPAFVALALAAAWSAVG